MNKKIIIILLCVIVLVLGVYAYKLAFVKPSDAGTSQADSNSEPAKFSTQDKILPTDVVVKVTDNGFVPDSVTVKKGTPVVWLNQTSSFVWPASDPHPLHTDYPGFDPQEPFKNGETWAFTFDRVGNWGYHNHLQPSMKGTVHVTE
ncbi:MAG: hypothetical protein WDN47_00415 [Candidatus Doudnabacteria bacterium]